jgi:2-dehydropantoate 2-reductase
MKKKKTNIVILGAGSIGSLFGGLLSRNNNVTLVCRKEHSKAIGKKGLKITGKTNIVVWPKAAETLAALGRPDVLFITVKSYDTAIAAKQARKIVGKDTMVVSLQNGLDNLETIKKTMGNSIIIGAITSHGAMLVAPGNVRHTGIGETVIGAFSKCTGKDLKNVSKLLEDAGIKNRISKDIKKGVWEKVLVNAAINPLATVLRKKNGALVDNPEMQDIMRLAVSEGVKVAISQKVLLDEKKTFEKALSVAMLTRNNKCSMLQDMERGRRTEIDHINGALVRLGHKKKINVPVNELLVDLIRILGTEAIVVT